MRTNPFRMTGLLALLLTTGACATSAVSPVAPPRLTLPRLATEPCELPTLPDIPTEADFEATYALRGSAVVQCDAARDLAVQTLLSERELIDRWLEGSQKRPWWSRFTPG